MLDETEIQRLVKKKGLKLDFIDYNIAFRIKDKVVLNKNLLRYDTYCMEVIEHELRHNSDNKLKKQDLMMDIFEGDIIKNLKFSFKHPRAFFQYIPIGKYDKKWFIDINLIILYVVLVLGIMVLFMVVI